ncbi:MAG: geranylgeranylglycerol-phosphate geranylgeranyltransferase [Lutibacter sp.]|uniref:geranylgeranylglycerol-phosphate geranylgeranyltransferase n=1 Tax=Lutibacter sp. TaxID=1925666 RepID=UPI0017A460F4|nr:geranylgeranylglycerol-phosphate geranylgeranyltransferase [Lutibacter sp.]MBT8316929.1 geranylgeranylglycerol-phosphate geranylgeranyltransferase [Lutibacter sp.]NNJ57789.1 geranylgeranylglycerol-phosphate geranylgeranyltransferase [Lutibacter sp.]
MDLLEISKKNTKKNIPLYIKLLSLFSVIRGYNIVLIVIAQYLASIFIFSPEKSLKYVLLDIQLYFIVLSTICVIAAGYIINNFYDSETDKINKPIKSKIDSIVSQRIKLQFYFLLNFIGVAIALLVSWRASLFFAVYIFLIWFYSHKLKKYPLAGLFSAAILAILPFFAVFVYFKNFSEIIFTHAAFLFFILLIRELIKDLERIKGDFIQNYQTIAVKYGEHFTKILISFLTILTLNPIYFLLKYPEIGGMKYFFYVSIFVLISFVIALWKSKSQRNYVRLHLILKLLIIAGVFSLALIDYNVIINKILMK